MTPSQSSASTPVLPGMLAHGAQPLIGMQSGVQGHYSHLARMFTRIFCRLLCLV